MVQFVRGVAADGATGIAIGDLQVAAGSEEPWHQVLPPRVQDIEGTFYYTPGVAILASSGSPGCMLLYEQREWQTQLFRPDMTSGLSLAQWRRTQMTDTQGRTTVSLDSESDECSFMWKGETAFVSKVCVANPSGNQSLGGPVIFVDNHWCADQVPDRAGAWKARQDTLILKMRVPPGSFDVPTPDQAHPYRLSLLHI